MREAPYSAMFGASLPILKGDSIMSERDCTLSKECVAELIHYDSQEGKFFWRNQPSLKTAGSLCSQGYWRIKIQQKNYKAHKIAWLLHYGEWPSQMIDHINGDRSDNRISNLRLATNCQNQMNRSLASRNNKSGMFLGVNYNKYAKAYAARLQYGGKRIHIGYFDSPEKAAEAYNAKKAELTNFAPSRA